jgi:alpha-mannosidase
MLPGVNLDCAVFNDTHTGFAQIPQVLRKAGYLFLRVTRPIVALDRKGYKRAFVWQGLDGSEVLFSYGPYGGFQTLAADDLDALNNYQKDWEKAAVTFYRLMKEPVDGAIPSSGDPVGLMYMPVGGDYTRPLREYCEAIPDEPYLDLLGFVREWNKRESAPVVWATPLTYFRELEKHRPELPTVKGILDPVGWPYWHGGQGSQGLYTWRERSTRHMVEAEILSCMATLLGARYPAQRFEPLWYDTLSFHPHDGLYVADEDVMKRIAMARRLEAECEQICTEALNALSHRIAAGPQKQAIAVVNPLNWSRREVVELHAVFPLPGTRRVKVTDAQGRTLPHQLIKVIHLDQKVRNYKEAWLLVETEVPSLGYTTLYIEPEEGTEDVAVPPPSTSSQVLESEHLRLRLGEGGVESLEDKARNVQYPGAGNPVYCKVKDTWEYHGGPSAGDIKVQEARWTIVKQGALQSTAKMTGRVGPHRVEMEVSLHQRVEQVDYALTVDSQGGNGYFVTQAPFTYAGNLQAGIPFGAETRDLSREPFGKDAGVERLRENIFYAHHWVDYSDGNKGLTLVAAEGQRGFLFDTKTRTLRHILLMTIEPRPPVNPMGEFENLLSSRFFQGKGIHSFSYSLIPHGGDWKQARSLFRAQERLYPVRATRVHPRKGADLALQKSFVTVSSETVAISSWAWKEEGYDLRLYDTSGEGGPVEVSFPFAATICHPVDFNGRKCDSPKLNLQGNRVQFQISPWEIVTLRFSLPSVPDYMLRYESWQSSETR